MNQDKSNTVYRALKTILDDRDTIKSLSDGIQQLKQSKLITDKKLLDNELSLGLATTDLEQALNANKVLSDKLATNNNLYHEFHRRLYRNMGDSKPSQARTTAMRMITEFNAKNKAIR